MQMVQTAHASVNLLKCRKVLKELRPDLVEDGFLGMLKEMLSEGSQLAFVEGENGYAVSSIGLRYL